MVFSKYILRNGELLGYMIVLFLAKAYLLGFEVTFHSMCVCVCAVIFPFLCFISAINKLLKPSVQFSLTFDLSSMALLCFEQILFSFVLLLMQTCFVDYVFPSPFSLVSQFCQLMLHLFLVNMVYLTSTLF